jgi:hypothetical protein
MQTSVQLGTISLEAAPGWNFYPMERWVVGRPQNRVGVFIVSTELRNAVASPPTHETCMSVAKSITGYTLEGTGFDRARDAIGADLIGGESFRADDDLVRVWYHHRPAGLIVAWFACPAMRENEPVVKELVRDCERMVLSVELPPPMAS